MASLACCSSTPVVIIEGGRKEGAQKWKGAHNNWRVVQHYAMMLYHIKQRQENTLGKSIYTCTYMYIWSSLKAHEYISHYINY